MNKYLIEHKIKTLTELWDHALDKQDFEFRGFNFRQWDFTFADGALGDAWIARKEVEANDFLEAINNFRKELFDIVRRVSFVSQCFATADVEPFFALRLNDNPEQKFFLSYFKESGHVPLHFEENEKESLKKLESFHHPVAFEYIAQSTRSATYTTKLAMLIIALESIAGEISPGKTNMQYIKNEILKDEVLHKEIFEYGNGIRNKIFHGKDVVGGKDYAQIIYSKIVAYFNEKYGAKINTEVVGPQRVPFGNYLGYRAWLRPSTDFSDWDLKRIIEIQDYDRERDDKLLNGTFFLRLSSMPDNY